MGKCKGVMAEGDLPLLVLIMATTETETMAVDMTEIVTETETTTAGIMIDETEIVGAEITEITSDETAMKTVAGIGTGTITETETEIETTGTTEKGIDTVIVTEMTETEIEIETDTETIVIEVAIDPSLLFSSHFFLFFLQHRSLFLFPLLSFPFSFFLPSLASQDLLFLIVFDV